MSKLKYEGLPAMFCWEPIIDLASVGESEPAGLTGAVIPSSGRKLFEFGERFRIAAGDAEILAVTDSQRTAGCLAHAYLRPCLPSYLNRTVRRPAHDLLFHYSIPLSAYGIGTYWYRTDIFAQY